MKFRLFKSPSKEFRSDDSKKDISNMSIDEAEDVINIVSDALQESKNAYLLPTSLLKGYNVYGIITAFKLRVAREFLWVINGGMSMEDFDKGIEYLYDSALLQIISRFVPDNRLNELRSLKPGTLEYRAKQSEIERDCIDIDENGFKDEKLSSLETVKSFSDFCKTIGGHDPLFWQKVYTRIGLIYNQDSPKANYPV